MFCYLQSEPQEQGRPLNAVLNSARALSMIPLIIIIYQDRLPNNYHRKKIKVVMK